MADSRLHLVHRPSGLAARLYSRFGFARSLAPESMDALIAALNDGGYADDDFTIVDESFVERVADNPALFNYIPGPAPLIEVDERDRQVLALKKENDVLRARLWTAEKKLSVAGK